MKYTGLVGASATQLPSSTGRAQTVSPNDKLGIGIIGCGGMGRADQTDFQRIPEVEVVAVCDVRQQSLRRALELAGPKARPFTDYRLLLENKDVHAVVIATPDHWHALMCADACAAGKDVYVEKPVSRYVREGRAMVEAARRYNRVVQVGLQQRSGSHFQRAVRAVQEGRIGKVHYIQTWIHLLHEPQQIGQFPDAPAPDDLDWNMWLGPAPEVPYNPNRLRWWRFFFDYAGGMITDWGTHLIDIAQWAMKVKGPLSATGSGGKFHNTDQREIPDTLQILYEYPGFLLSFSALFHSTYGHNGDDGWGPFGSYGTLFQGTEGTLFVDRAGYRITPQARGRSDPAGSQSSRDGFDDLTGVGMYFENKFPPERGTSSVQHFAHVRNFVKCVKSREMPIADIEIGHQVTATCHVGNIAFRTGRKVLWDADAERITNSAEANEMLARRYRAPWSLPGLGS